LDHALRRRTTLYGDAAGDFNRSSDTDDLELGTVATDESATLSLASGALGAGS
jgi:hypothetical protein